MTIHVKRVYEPASPEDGHRILVDRLWPRGLSKEQAHVNEWLKVLAPTNELRRWFHADIGQYPEFRQRYRAELFTSDDAIRELKRLVDMCQGTTVTLLFASKYPDVSNAVVLSEFIREWIGTDHEGNS
ncbi:DUF488 family protein [Alicyclobacillus curvatus]|nr:DUF488 family protein [Alicyclobacillus curvatus]